MKKRILILSLLLLVLSLGCVSASDDLNATDALAIDEGGQDTIVSGGFTGNFAELQNIIDDADEFDLIYLQKDYKGSGTISIDKELYIDGLGHSIDAQGESRIFYISADVALENITFLNGNGGNSNGGAIYSTSYLELYSCSFAYNVAKMGGAVSSDDYTLVEDCLFYENHALRGGGAIYSYHLFVGKNSIFFNNTADDYGGSIYGYDLEVLDSSFVSYDKMEFIDFYNFEKEGLELYLENNTMYGVNSYDIWHESLDPITSPVTLTFNTQTVKKGQEIEIATFEDDMGNSIRTDDLIEVQITDKNSKVVDEFNLKFSDGYKYTCNLDDGVYTVNAAVSSSVATDVKVRKGTLTVSSQSEDKIELKASDVTKYYRGDEAYAVTVYKNGIPVSGASVSISLNGAEYTRTTNDNGIAKLNLNLPSGTYQITSSYKGKQVTSKVTIKPTITGKDATGTTQSTKYTVTALNSDGTPLKNTAVTFKINSGTYTETTNSNGVATLNLKLSAGTYQIEATNPITLEKVTNTLTVEKSQSGIIIEAEDFTKYYGGSEKFSVRITDDDGNPLADKDVKITINGQTFTRTTDAMGIASLSINLMSNSYPTTVECDGKRADVTVTVKPTITGKDVTGTTQSTKYSVTVLNSDGTPLKNTAVTFKKGSDTFTETTNSNGVATLNLKLSAGTYQIEATNPKTSEKVTNTLTVEKSQSSLIIEAEDFTKYYGGSERFTVKITDNDGNPLANKDVKISINGQAYTRTTDANGIAGMNVGLNSKVYPTTVECDGEEADVTVTVRPTIDGNDITKMYKNATQYSAKFVDSQGNPLKNTEVEFNINGIFYKKTTDSNGVARMNINLIPKTYVITAQNPTTNEKFTNNITVKPTIVENHDLTKYYKNASRYTLRLLGDDGNPVGAGVSVEFNINGRFYTRQSDANGYVGMNINLIPGDYIVTANYNGLRASNSIHVLNVLSGRDVNMEYKDGSKYEVKLLDGQGRPYAGQTITLNINGRFYDKTTDSNGIARLTINLPSGNYVITASYNGLNTANNIVVRGSSMILHKSYGFTVEVPKDARCEDLYTTRGICDIKYSNGISARVSGDSSSYDSDVGFYMGFGGYKNIGYLNDWIILNKPEQASTNDAYVLIRNSNPIYLISCNDLSIARQLASSHKIVPGCVPDGQQGGDLTKYDCNDFYVSLPKSASIELTEDEGNACVYTVQYSGNTYQITEDGTGSYTANSYLNMVINAGGSSMGDYNGWKLAAANDNYFAFTDHRIVFAVMGPDLSFVQSIVDNIEFK